MRTTDEKMAELIEQLKGAVESIPSYIERSSQMWILVPPVKHADSTTPCDFNSWRRRGWCRMEFAAAKLAVGEDMPLMVIKSTVDMTQAGVQYFNPCDTFKLCASKGDFSVESDRACQRDARQDGARQGRITRTSASPRSRVSCSASRRSSCRARRSASTARRPAPTRRCSTGRTRRAGDTPPIA